MSEQPGYVLAKRGEQWAAIKPDSVQRVRGWRIDSSGVTALVKDPDGMLVDTDALAMVTKAGPVDALRIAGMQRLLWLAERATTDREWASINRAADFIMRGPDGG